MAVPGVEVARERDVIEICLARPDRRNAFDERMVEDLLAVLATPYEDPSIRAVLISGRGTTFCSGFDLSRLDSLGQPGAKEIRIVERLMTAICDVPVPVVAAITGPAVGAGCDLALACDIRVGHIGSTFRVPAARTGLLYGTASTQRLIDAFGRGVASGMLLSGEPVGAQRCLTLGVLWSLVHEDDVVDHARSLARTISANAPLSVAVLKRFAGRNAPGRGTDELHALEDLVWTSQDAASGVSAFLDRRTADFVGR